jgi:hypothetical protein
METAAALAWPALFLVFAVAYHRPLHRLLLAALARVERGDAVTIGFVQLGHGVGELQIPERGEFLTDDHLALIHRSWRVPKRDLEFGCAMYQIHLIVFGTPEALARIQYVVYRLKESYPRPVQVGGPCATGFELKELANGYSLVRAEVFVQGQTQPVYLSRFVDLTDESPRLKGIYQR